MFNKQFGDEPSPLHFSFQAAFGHGNIIRIIFVNKVLR
jgi:hypothetical protein